MTGRRLRRFGAACTAGLLTAGLLTAARAAASIEAGAPAGASASALPAATGTAPAVVTLPTGDRIALAAGDGRQEASLLPGSPDRLLTEFELDGDLYVVPEAALKGGGQLGLARFDVTRAATGGAAAGGGGQGPADRAVPRLSRPYPMQTLTVNGTDDMGQPDQADAVMVVNLTDTRLFSEAESFYHGQFKVSVPRGSYALLSFFYDTERQTVRVVVRPELSVTGNRTVTLDARTATTPISVATPRPADPVEQEVTVDRAATAYGDVEYSFLEDTQQRLSWYAAPTAPATIGALHYYVYDRLSSPPGETPAYSYAAEFPADGAIPVHQAYKVTPDQLATQDTSYYAAGQSQVSLETRFSFLPWESVNFRADSELTRPLRRTEYYTGNPDITWQTSLIGRADLVAHTFADYFQDSYHRYLAGQRTRVSWLAGPLREGTEYYEPAAKDGFACPACREPGALDFYIWPFGDNDAGHVSFLGPDDAASYALDENGRRIATGTGMLQGLFAVDRQAATYRLTYDVTRAEPWWTQSTSVQTQWIFRSAAEAGPGPAGWTCLDGSADCTPIPLLTARYQLPGGMLGRERPGPTTLGLRVGHFQDSAGSGSRPPEQGAAVTGVSAAVSFDGGAVWSATRITGRPGHYTVRYANPPASATDGFAAIRISARDAAGGELTQTVLNAYAISP